MRGAVAALCCCVAAATAVPREAWDDLSWLGGGFRGAPCAGEAWLRTYNATQDRMLRGELSPRFVLVRPHSRAGLGNRLRVARAGLTLAALTRRVLVARPARRDENV